jgi:two-component system sensor histidine kinase/response regulator
MSARREERIVSGAVALACLLIAVGLSQLLAAAGASPRHVVDGLLAGVYLAAAVVFVAFVLFTRRDLAFRWAFLAFAAYFAVRSTVLAWRFLGLPHSQTGTFLDLLSLCAATVAVLVLAWTIPRFRETIRRARESTEHRRALDAMAARYRLLAERSRDAMLFLRRRDLRIIEANQAAVDLYGWPYERLLWKTGYDLRVPEVRDHIDRLLPQAETFSKRYETLNQKADGSVFPVEVSVASAFIDGEHLLVAVVRDVTERKETEETVRQALEAAKEAEERSQRALESALAASKFKSEFVATISHEIRTPLNGVIGMLELLMHTGLTDEQRAFTEIARDSAHVLLSVINDVLDFSKIEAGKVELETTAFDPLALVEGVAGILGPQARRKGISLTTYVDAGIPACLLGDPTRLQQILLNLAGNAVKFTERGSVLLCAEPGQSGPRELAVRFSVRDTGIGIPQSALPHVFDAFVQADGSTTRNSGGTGLGLAICKRLVERMGGTLAVESTLGTGSTFSFSIPLQLPDSVAPRAERSALHGRRALVVEGDEMARGVFLRYLRSWKANADAAGTAESALELLQVAAARGAPYDVALVGLQLPDADGFALAGRVKANPALCGMRLLLVAAHDEPRQARRAFEAGFSGYLLQPVRQSHLYDALADADLGAHDQERPAPQTAVLASRRVLLAEDNATNRLVARLQLGKLGCSVDIAEDGRQAVKAAADGCYDVILLDCQMPEMDGYEAARTIRRDERRSGRHTPIVALTANALASERETCLAAGMDDYLAKPIDLERLREMLERWAPKAAETPAAPTLDEGRLVELFGGDLAAANAFLCDAAREFRDLCNAIVTQADPKRTAALAHTLKGAAANAGATDLSTAARRVEEALRADVPVPLDELLHSLERFERSVARLRTPA